MVLRIVFSKLNKVDAPKIQGKWTPTGSEFRENGNGIHFEEQKKQFSVHEEQFQQQQMQFSSKTESSTTQLHSSSVRLSIATL